MKSGEVVALQVTRGRGIGECLRFLEKLKKSCKNKPTVYTDSTIVQLANEIGTLGSYFGIRNSIEQWFSELKRRIRQFNVCFPNENLGSYPLLGSYRNLRFLFRATDSIVSGLKVTVSF